MLLKFVNRLTYAFALPATICVWYLSTTLLVGIQISISIHAPPSPREAYTQAFWYGLTSSILYFFCASILLVNLAGYLLGHYTKQLKLTEAQRTLTLQSFVFSIWLAGGAGIFEAVQNAYGPLERQWSYSDALYFCDVTILTIGTGAVAGHATSSAYALTW